MAIEVAPQDTERGAQHRVPLRTAVPVTAPVVIVPTEVPVQGPTSPIGAPHLEAATTEVREVLREAVAATEVREALPGAVEVTGVHQVVPGPQGVVAVAAARAEGNKPNSIKNLH